jgi:hypothetical protein
MATGVLSEKYIHEEVGPPKEVYAAIIFYNDTLPLLKECVRSCQAIGLKTIMIDGKFSAFEDDNKYFHSTDGCMEYAKSVADIFIPAPRRGWHDQWGGQPIKRTQYFKVCDENDFVIVIDSDEGFKTKSRINVRSLTYRYMRLKLWNYASHHVIVNVRGFRVYKDLCYMRRHCAIYRTSFIKKSGNNKHDGLAVYNRERLKPMKAMSGEELVMINYDSLRSVQRQKWDDLYMFGRREDKTLAVVKRINRYNQAGFVGNGISKALKRRMNVSKRLEQINKKRGGGTR